MTRMTVLSTLLAATLALPAAATARAQSQTNSSAQQNSIDQDVDLLRKDVRSQKKQIIAATLLSWVALIEALWQVL